MHKKDKTCHNHPKIEKWLVHYTNQSSRKIQLSYLPFFATSQPSVGRFKIAIAEGF